MTPTQIIEGARNKYNATSDNFYSDQELLGVIYQACLELAIETECIERTYETTTVIDQQEYNYPTNIISIKRITYNGRKLEPVTFREDDRLTLYNQATTQSGTPQYYTIFNETIALRPIPDDVQELKVWGTSEPQIIDSIQAPLEIPSRFHYGITDFVSAYLAEKDQNFSFATNLLQRWADFKVKAKQDFRRSKRGDSFSHVQSEEALSTSILGLV